MNEVTLPPAPNWYLSTILACANDGTVAWGSKNAIVIAKHVGERKTLDYSIITNAHVDKVNSLAFSPEYGTPGKNLLLSGGDEHIIRIWDLDTMTAVLSQSYLNAKQKVIGVDWSKSDPTLVCCISTEGSLISWNTSYSVCQTIPLGKMTATCIACCPHKSNIVAVGTKSGLVYVINLQGSGSVTYRMRGHDTEITSLSWCPSDVSVFNESIAKDILLASGSKDKSIFIWRACGDGRYEIELALPNHPLESHQHKAKLGPSAGNFTTVCWLEPKYLLASSTYGELLCLDLSTSMKKPVWKLIHGNHGRGLFSIANVPIDNSSDGNWRNRSKTEIWTTAQDRQLICTIIEDSKSKTEYRIPTQAGYIYCIAACPLDTSRIAYGGGDALLRLWNLSESHETTFDITSLWQKIMGRITAIAWHPEQENLLAFGTGEGRVGLYDTNNVNKAPIIYRCHHRRTVYSLGWAKNPSNKIWSLYSCGDFELVYYQCEKPNAAPTVFIKKNCTEFSWKPDLSCMAIGYEDGSLSFVNHQLEPCGRSIMHLKKAVQCLAWHPDSTATDSKYSPLRHYLAASTNANAISIFDMTDMINRIVDAEGPDSGEESNNTAHEIIMNGKDSTIQHKLVGTLVGHVDRVVCLAWSPHFSGHLVSGSCDNTAQVWNVRTKELIGTYVGHCGPIYSCMWSPLDPDFIITGSSDFSLRIWKLSEQKIIIPKEKLQMKKSKGKKNKKSDKNVTNSNVEKITDDIAKVSLTNGVSSNGSANFDNSIPNGTVNNQESKELNIKEKKNKNKKGSFLSVYRKSMSDKELILSSCLKLARKVLGQSDNQTTPLGEEEIPTIFGTKEDLSNIINIETIAHLAHGQHTMATEMNIWNNNLRQQLEDAAKELRLNDFLVSLAPSLSVKMWQTMCETYATQLIRELNPTKAVCYLLCIHKIHKAIEVFMESKMYREAYVLARCKLEVDDAVLNNILEEWAKNSLVTGQFEDAAQCYIQLGDITKAAKVLARRKDVLALETAAQLATLVKDEDLSETILDQAVTELLLHLNHQKCHELINKFPIIQYRSIHVKASEELKKLREMLDDSHIVSWLNGESKNGLLPILNERHQGIQSEYKKLLALISPEVPENQSALWMMVSQQIALASISPTKEMKIRHIVSALGKISQYEVLNSAKSDESLTTFLIGFLSILDAECYSLSSILKYDELPIYRSLRAYMGLGLLNWLVDTMEKRPDSEVPINMVVTTIGETLMDGLDRNAVKHWTLTSEISKLEASLAASMGNSQKDHDDEKSQEDPTSLLQRLEIIRTIKEKFIAERVCTPSPILIYSKAIELCSLLTGEMKNFSVTVAEAWKLAVS